MNKKQQKNNKKKQCIKRTDVLYYVFYLNEHANGAVRKLTGTEAKI